MERKEREMGARREQPILAVLIDADNTSPAIVEPLFAEIAKYGVATVRRIYGDWTSPHLRGWQQVLLDYSIHPIQQFSYTRGKNATDCALIIDAMDLLYTGRFDGFCIVASDSDYTRLATRIREQGLLVYGFGERKTPAALVNACDKFIFTEILLEGREDERRSVPDEATVRRDAKLGRMLREAVTAEADEDGWAYLGSVANHILKQSPSFDPRNYGYARLRALMRATGMFEFEERTVEGSSQKQIYVRCRQLQAERRREARGVRRGRESVTVGESA
ncbi:MAG: NYN domain-containing protein [bacterium]|nr:NYN domain-containing protein [bacterium]